MWVADLITTAIELIAGIYESKRKRRDKRLKEGKRSALTEKE